MTDLSQDQGLTHTELIELLNSRNENDLVRGIHSIWIVMFPVIITHHGMRIKPCGLGLSWLIGLPKR